MDTRPCSYEVDVDRLQVIDRDGNKHWLSLGQDVPKWVTNEQIAQLLERGAVLKFERL